MTAFLDGCSFNGHPVSFSCVLLHVSRGIFFLFGMLLPGTRHPFFRPVRSGEVLPHAQACPAVILAGCGFIRRGLLRADVRSTERPKAE